MSQHASGSSVHTLALFNVPMKFVRSGQCENSLNIQFSCKLCAEQQDIEEIGAGVEI